MGDVHETSIKGHQLAWKRMVFRRKVGEAEMKEIKILKKLRHAHMIQLVGTYTHRQFLGLLLFPVAVCDLHTYFDDVEAYWRDEDALDSLQRARLTALDYFSSCQGDNKALAIYSRVGCLISAITYLHDQKIRHKDLKPSNILLVRDGLYVSDFGSATDFSLLSQSATDNERGTPRYFAPEVADWKPNGRAADIFSLGCVLLESLTLNLNGSLESLRKLRTSGDTSYHANLDSIQEFLSHTRTVSRDLSPRGSHLVWEIRTMLERDPEGRPTAPELLKRIESCDSWGRSPSSVFGDCCKTPLVATKEIEEAKADYAELRKKYTNVKRLYFDQKEQIEKLRHEKEDLEIKISLNTNAYETKNMDDQWRLRNKEKELDGLKAQLEKARNQETASAQREMELQQMNIRLQAQVLGAAGSTTQRSTEPYQTPRPVYQPPPYTGYAGTVQSPSPHAQTAFAPPSLQANGYYGAPPASRPKKSSILPWRNKLLDDEAT